MAASYILYTGDGVQLDWTFNKPYIDKDTVHVYVNGVEIFTHTWPTSSTVRISPAVANGVSIKIARREVDGPLVTFDNGNNFVADDLNTALRQALYRAEESTDDVGDAVPLYEAAISASEVATTKASEASSSASAAASSQSAATTSATSAASSASAASGSATAAAGSATSAATSATNASASASAASTSASNAASSASAASTSATNAASSATAAAGSATAASTSATNAGNSATAAASSASAASTSASSASSSATAAASSATAAANSAASMTNVLTLISTWDASSGSFPSTAGIKKGYTYVVSVAGTVNGTQFGTDDKLIAAIDSPSSTTFAGNWYKIEGGTLVSSQITAALGFTPADQAKTVTGGGLVTGGGDLSSNRVLTVTAAVQADITTGTDTTKATTPKAVADYVAAAIAAIQTVPAGAIMSFAMNSAPVGWLKANGAAISRSTYAALFAALVKSATATVTIASPGVFAWTAHGLSLNDPVKLKTTGSLPTPLATNTTYYVKTIPDADHFTLSTSPGGTAINTSGSQSGVHTAINAPHGDGDGSTTFNVPDRRGYFRRGWDDGRGVDSNRSFGSSQTDSIIDHTHSGGGGGGTASGSCVVAAGVQNTGGVNSPNNGGTETRPKNYADLVCIKY